MESRKIYKNNKEQIFKILSKKNQDLNYQKRDLIKIHKTKFLMV
jgi:hypothetical protein